MSISGDIVLTINSRFSSERWLDFEVASLKDGFLRIVASTDFCYYHLMEMEFSDVCYFDGPMAWGSNPTDDDIVVTLDEATAAVVCNKFKLGRPGVIIAFNSDDGFQVVVASSEVHVNFDTVYYYIRKNLGPYERIDPRFLDQEPSAGSAD
jgi:hypothetical protein